MMPLTKEYTGWIFTHRHWKLQNLQDSKNVAKLVFVKCHDQQGILTFRAFHGFLSTNVTSSA